MKVAVGADHAGFELKGEIVRWLESEGHQVNDIGAHEFDPDDDYPDLPSPLLGPSAQGNQKGASSSAEAESAPASPPIK